jgi:hypothetical protein
LKPPSKQPTPSSNSVGSVKETELSLAWQQLGAVRGFNPLPLSKARIKLSGEVKSGKTSLLADRPRTMVLDFDDSARAVPNALATYIPILEYEDLEKVYRLLTEEARSSHPTFDHVVFDTTDRLQALVAEQLSFEKKQSIYEWGGGMGGYNLIQARVLSFPRMLYRAGYGWSCVCHQKWVDTTDVAKNKVTYLRDAVTPAVSGGLEQDADYLWKTAIETQRELVDVKGQSAKQAVYHHRVVLSTMNKTGRDFSQELGSRIPMPETLVIPKVHPFSVVQQAWDAAVRKIREEVK